MIIDLVNYILYHTGLWIEKPEGSSAVIYHYGAKKDK